MTLFQWMDVDAPRLLYGLDQFCEMVREEVPGHAHLPSVVELKRMEVESFTKSVVLWDKEKAPVSGKRFKQYQDTARKTEKLLME